MGQKQSKSSIYSRYLSSLPEYYERIDSSEVYAMRNENHAGIQSTNPQIPNPENLPSKQSHDQQEILDSKTVQSQKSTYMEGLPSHLRHFMIILNEFQTKDYLNHLVYRNQPEFKEFIIQVPFGEIEKHEKYTKIHLYAQEVALTLNHVFNLPFQDMCMILYTSLIAYKYLYSYFGLFKIQENMIGFTKKGKTKVWLNHKLTKDKPLPIIADINLKRHKQEENYMVDDLMQIFWNKVDRQTVPKNFTLINKFSSIRNSRHNPSRLSLSRMQSEAQMSKSMLKSLQNNLIQDFSEGSFDKCLEYIEGYFNMRRPEFLKADVQSSKVKPNPQVQQGDSPLQKQVSMIINSKTQSYRNFIPSIEHLVKNQKEFCHNSTDLRSSTVNFSINFRQVRASSYKPQIRMTNSFTDSKFQSKGFNSNQSNREFFGMAQQSTCRPVNLQSSKPYYFNLPIQSQLTKEASTLSPSIIKSEERTISNQALRQMNNQIKEEESSHKPLSLQSSAQKFQKISMRAMMQPVVNSSLTPSDTVINSHYQTCPQKNPPYASINFEKKYPVSGEFINSSSSYMNGRNMVISQVKPYQFSSIEQSQTVNRSSQFFNQGYQKNIGYQPNQNTIINKVVNI